MPEGNPENIPVLKIDQPMELARELQPKADATARKLYEDVAPSIAKVKTDKGAGSGFFVDKDGRMVTDAHVVQDATEVIVTVRDGDHYKARIEKIDDINDLAVLKVEGIKPEKIKAAEFGDGLKLTADQPVYALGHPQGVRPAYISPGYFRFETTPLEFKERENPLESLMKIAEHLSLATPKEAKDLEAALARPIIHTKLHIEPGNSGGPLLDANGKVVGVADFIETNSSSHSYFTPSEKVKELLADKDHRFEFTYTRAPEKWVSAYKWQWENMAPVAMLETGAIGLGGYKLASTMPRLAAVGIGFYGVTSLIGDADRLLHSTDSRDSWKYGIATASDAIMTAGAVARFIPATRAYSLLTMGIGLVGKLGSDFVPNRLVLTDISRKDGDLRPLLNAEDVLND